MKGKNKKLIIGGALVLVFVVLCVIFKYKILLPALVIAIVAAVIMINRAILRKRKSTGENEVTQYVLKDSEINKFTEYFVNSDEKYVSSLGNGYIMNYLANGSISKGFAVISDKRVYFRGSCFSGQGKSFHKTDEERTVDIKDVTGSGFVYQRYIGILLGLAAALLALLVGFCGSAVGAWVEWQETTYRQGEADEIGTIVDEIRDSDDKISDIQNQISDNQTNMEDLQSQLTELEALQTQSVLGAAQGNLDVSDILYGTEINEAYGDYLYQLNDIFLHSRTFDLLYKLNEGAWDVVDPSYGAFDDWVDNANIVLGNTEGKENPFAVGDDLVYFYSIEECLYISPEFYCVNVCGYSPETVQWAYWADDYVQEGYPYTQIIGTGWLKNDSLGYGVTDAVTAMDEDMGDAFYQAYLEFMSVVAPEYSAGGTPPSLQTVVLNYINAHPEASFASMVDLSGISTEYDDQIAEIKQNISDLEAQNSELEGQLAELEEMKSEQQLYEERYDEAKRVAFRDFLLAALASAAAGLLITFLVSCFLVFLDYLKKRKTMFQIQYAGGSIAFDVSYYAKAEIEDFQKQLRRAKDFNEQVKSTSVPESTVQTPTASETKETSLPDELRKYAELLKDGLITQEEYDAVKKKILGL